MKKNLFIIGFVMMLWASPVLAQQALESNDGDIKVGYRWISLDGSARSGEYEYFQKSDALSAVIEWDRLPHRFMLEYHSLNEKDFFKSLDYSFSDIVVFNATSRKLFHNLDHYSFGAPDPTPLASPLFVDNNQGDPYSTENTFNTFFLRLKTPNFPFHFYAEARSFEKEGTVQQRFLRGYFQSAAGVGAIDKLSQSREIDWRTNEVKAGANCHLGPVELDYSHTEKRFEANGDKVLYDLYPAAYDSTYGTIRASGTYPHNLVPDLESSSDTVKIHTSHTGRIVAAATYTTGEKENRDSGARTDYWNAAGDLTITPLKNLVVFFKYRHYDLTAENPDTVTIIGSTNTYTYNVRDSISSQKDIMTGTMRYRVTDRLTLKGEYSVEKIQREVGTAGATMILEVPDVTGRTTLASWEVAPETTKSAAKFSATYRIMKKLSARADYSHSEIDNPAYNFDPDKSDAAKVSLTWTPTQRLSALVSYSGLRERRDDLESPLAGGDRETARDQALGSVTVLVGKRSSITTSYAYFRNQADHTVTFDLAGTSTPEPGVPYDDVAHVGSVLLTHALSDAITVMAEATRSYSRGSFRNSGSVSADTLGLAEFSDLKVVEDIYAAGVEIAFAKDIGTEFRYQYREYNDKVDSSNDGTTQIVLATMSVKW
ncbi:MAG: hypothetical protein AABZ10_15480 [Nitrospirota bacterium]